jgi:hypothetical protein
MRSCGKLVVAALAVVSRGQLPGTATRFDGVDDETQTGGAATPAGI